MPQAELPEGVAHEAAHLQARIMVEEMRAAGTLPTKLPEGKMGDSLSYGIPRVESDDPSS